MYDVMTAQGHNELLNLVDTLITVPETNWLLLVWTDFECQLNQSIVFFDCETSGEGGIHGGNNYYCDVCGPNLHLWYENKIYYHIGWIRSAIFSTAFSNAFSWIKFFILPSLFNFNSWVLPDIFTTDSNQTGLMSGSLKSFWLFF